MSTRLRAVAHTFVGPEGYAGFRRGQVYELFFIHLDSWQVAIERAGQGLLVVSAEQFREWWRPSPGLVEADQR